jgi:hypothetical protein
MHPDIFGDLFRTFIFYRVDEIISQIKPCSFFHPLEVVEVIDAVFWEIECASWLSGSCWPEGAVQSFSLYSSA